MSERKLRSSSVYFEAFLGRFGPSAESEPLALSSTILGKATSLESPSNLSIAGLKERHFQTTLSVQPPWRVIAAKGRPFLLGYVPERSLEHIEKCFQKLDGHFCLVAAAPRQLVLATDLLGCSAIYYYQHNNLLHFSTHLGLLIASLKVRPDLDELGLAAMIAGSCCVNGRTIYNGVRRLKAGQYLEASCSNSSMKLAIQTYANPADNLFDPVPAYDDAQRRFEELLCAAVERDRSDGPYGVMLSSGFDSTAVSLGLILNGHNDIRAATYGEWRSHEMRGARRFAARHGITHLPLPYGGWKLGSEATRIAALSGGGAGLQVEHNSIGFKRAAKRFSRVATGFLGGSLTGAHLPKNGCNELEIILPFKSMLAEKVQTLFRDEFGEIDAEIFEEKKTLSSLTDIQKCLFFDLTIRQGTWISTTFDQCGWHLPVSHPFYDRELMRFCCSLAKDDLADQRLYRAWVQRQSSATAQHLTPLRNPSWLAYAITQRALDLCQNHVPRLQTVYNVNWKKRIDLLRPWLRSLLDCIKNPKFRAAFEAQLKHDTGRNFALLVIAGVVLGVSEPHSESRTLNG